MELIEILKNEDRETAEKTIVRDNIERIARDIMVTSYTLLNAWKGDETTAINCLSFITHQAKQGLKLFGDIGFNKNEVTNGNRPETWLAHNRDTNQCCLKELEAIKTDWKLLIQDMEKLKNAKEREIDTIFEELQSVTTSYNKEGKRRIDNDLIGVRYYLQKGK